MNFSHSHPLHKFNNDSNKKHSICIIKSSKPINYYCHSRIKIESFHKSRFRAEALRDKYKSSFAGVGRGKIGILLSKGRRTVVVKSNNGFGGGGGKISSETARVLGNLALAIFLTYISMTGQLGWLLDAIVSLWLLAVLVPVVGIGAFLWWAGRDIVQSNCPNCGNEFQVFKSTLKDEVQLCPFCTQPFSVEGDKFVRDPVTFSNQSTTFDQVFGEFSARTKGKESSGSIVDVEAEIRDAD
ncbi:hypothetical protein PHJA_002768600 [Phtheirospermum japonicum]|uniref:Uncharacterized protein n=1 Tax=Phtheirospermum japonicum TaxID=374723 RepID=A0A830DHK3_9LAMI|nr:hypothetical protein PHJA_002768600 [Phtheirospermum japonicum]